MSCGKEFVYAGEKQRVTVVCLDLYHSSFSFKSNELCIVVNATSVVTNIENRISKELHTENEAEKERKMRVFHPIHVHFQELS